jgi:hypothetical protein
MRSSSIPSVSDITIEITETIHAKGPQGDKGVSGRPKVGDQGPHLRTRVQERSGVRANQCSGPGSSRDP